MHIYGPLYVHGAQALQAPHHTSPVEGGSAAPSQPADELDISAAGQYLDQIRELPEIRHDRVTALREAIAGGEYETDEKLELALSRLLDEFA